MSKAFTRESDSDDDDLEPAAQLPVGVKNYITPTGYRKLQEELDQLWRVARLGIGQDYHLGSLQRRQIGKWRLYLWQETPARDRPARAFFAQAP